MKRSNAWYGWVPDLPDHRDKLYCQFRRQRKQLPPHVDLRVTSDLAPMFDQGPLGSCTGQGVGKVVEFAMEKQGVHPGFAPSRLFIYYNERVIEGTINEDAGAQIRDGIKSVARWGVCDESLWPYDIARFTHRPTEEAYAQALDHQAVQYHRISHSLREMQDCLAQGFPFVFGFAVFESFENQVVSETGMMPMPSPVESMMGGHAVVAVGYDVPKRVFIIQNSWGEDWGDKGYFYMPFDFITNPDFCDDRWVVTLMEDSD